MNRGSRRALHVPGVMILGATLVLGAGDPPRNPELGDSPFPMAHRNNYSQASSDLRGVEPGDLIEAELAAAPGGRRRPRLFARTGRHGDLGILGKRRLVQSRLDEPFGHGRTPRSHERRASRLDRGRFLRCGGGRSFRRHLRLSRSVPRRRFIQAKR